MEIGKSVQRKIGDMISNRVHRPVSVSTSNDTSHKNVRPLVWEEVFFKVKDSIVDWLLHQVTASVIWR